MIVPYISYEKKIFFLIESKMMNIFIIFLMK